MGKNEPYIRSLEKGLILLSSFLPNNDALSLSSIAHTNHMTFGTAHRYLITLKKLGYLDQDPETKKYYLTSKVLNLGFSVFRSMSLRTRIFPHMLAVARELNTTTQCAVLDGVDIIYIDRVRSGELVNLDLTTGSRLPAYCTSMGKAILAFLEETECCALIDQMDLEPLTPFTITSKKGLWEDLKKTRQRGYAICTQELTLGLQTLAVPIFKENRKVEAAFGLSFPYHQENSKSREEIYVKRMIEVSKKVSLEY